MSTRRSRKRRVRRQNRERLADARFFAAFDENPHAAIAMGLILFAARRTVALLRAL